MRVCRRDGGGGPLEGDEDFSLKKKGPPDLNFSVFGGSSGGASKPPKMKSIDFEPVIQEEDASGSRENRPPPLNTEVRFHFSIPEDTFLTVPELTASLKGIEYSARQMRRVLNSLAPGLNVRSVNVRVKEIKPGSLQDNVIVQFFFKDEKTMNASIELIRRLTGVEFFAGINPLLGAAWALTIVGGLAYATKRMLSKKADSAEGTTIHIEGDYNTVITKTADVFKTSPDAVREISDKAIKNKDANARASSQLASPVAGTSAGMNVAGFTVSPEAMKQVPVLAVEDEIEQIKIIKHAEIQIRALDLDKPKAGWAVIVASESENRIRAKLADGVHPDELKNRGNVHADIRVFNRYNPVAGEVRPVLVEILAVYPAKPT